MWFYQGTDMIIFGNHWLQCEKWIHRDQDLSQGELLGTVCFCGSTFEFLLIFNIHVEKKIPSVYALKTTRAR